jgi:hypothetical protein
MQHQSSMRSQTRDFKAWTEKIGRHIAMVLLQKSKKLRSTVDLLKKGNDDIINAKSFKLNINVLEVLI